MDATEDSGIVIECASCGAPNPADAEACRNCGASMPATVEASTPPNPQTTPDDAADIGASVQCQRCGQYVPFDQAIRHHNEGPWQNTLLCTTCNAELIGPAEGTTEPARVQPATEKRTGAIDVVLWLAILAPILFFACLRNLSGI